MALVRTAVELAIVRHDLIYDDGREISLSDADRACVSADTWDALNGIGTCDATVIPELSAVIAINAALVDALKASQQFIQNGIEFGYVDRPKPDTTEAKTLPMIEAALALAEKK